MDATADGLTIILADTGYRPFLEAEIRRRVPQARLVLVAPDGTVSGGDLADGEIFFCWVLPQAVVEATVQAAPRLRWFHLMSAGVDSLMFPALRDSEIIITNSSGAHAIPIAESVLAMMLYAAKNLRQSFANSAARHWTRVPKVELYGQTAGILGLGAIGRATAQRLHCLGMNVIALTRRPEAPRDEATGVAVLYGPDELDQFLAQCDWVVVTAALTAETHHMLGEAQFRQMKPTAWLVNVSRGAISDEAALLRALDEGWIAGACLDAFTQEPLPPDSPFWDHPKVVMTPHNSGSSDRRTERAVALAMDNLERYCSGRPLLNVVDKQRGY